ncbi:conserved membrane hypothetical protein [Candidatus Nitrospira nitrosa]|uniref:DUF898 domain-containing protein n=1 Tax=Candidatus Nitrospira nitrosa TaxID=1742972 RepID=A0A0S4L5F8_9BACT|nr:YjgN family protein [Candidatus Nitrospira nitrosa]CUS32945.1 conserved membrane hypothetical protein [Candidatus Nitrospira nitrosa]
MFGLFQADKGLHLTCHQCRTRHRVRNAHKLEARMRAHCQRCRTPFVVVAAKAKQPASPVSTVAEDPLETSAQGDFPQPRRFAFTGKGESLFGISLVNTFLTLITCGLYMFWAKARVRKYLFSQTEFAGDRFAYHGTGPELFRGFLKATAVFGIPYACLAMGPQLLGMEVWIQASARFLAGALFVIFIPIATVGARRYRLTRTSWRGIRCSFVGSAWQYIKLYLTGALLNVITVGTYYPFYDARRQTFLISHSRVGNQSFHFDGQGRDLAKDFCLAVLLTPFAFGLNWFWYSAKRQRYYWEHTSFAESRFAFTGTGGELCRLKLVNVCLLVFTLGFAWPWTTIRNAHFIFEHLTFTGPANLDTLTQATASSVDNG